eukprot:c20321_g3_i2.p1 GENE.c20321_g3_i2~~c20321_g3_i2.p1  ORF type:complete len:575 (-),score=99.72 c20321_g3_i2:44-1768(-)
MGTLSHLVIGMRARSPDSTAPRMEPERCAQELRMASRLLGQRGLMQSAKWAAEHVASVATSNAQAMCVDVPALSPHLIDPPMTVEDEDIFYLAKCCFDMREYLRCDDLLKPLRSPKARFLALYSLYLGGEKRREEETMEKATPEEREQGLLATNHRSVVNRNTQRIEREIKHNQELMKDPLILYLLGVVLSSQEKTEEAIKFYCESLNLFPWNWSAWLDLTSCLAKSSSRSANIPNHWMRLFYEGHSNVEQQTGEAAYNIYKTLLETFPNSNYLIAQLAVSAQHMGNQSEARDNFEKITRTDPYRLDHLDIFSNLLYVQADQARLSHLAHHMISVDKFRPETCCTIGNYYSIKQDHPRAVLHFARALRLNPRWLSAWTLMGHEYLEMKNSAAAIQAYRRAVDINPRDYRAWYGLGQTYEILQMHYYSLFYFQMVTSLRPYDARFWVALGACYAHLARYQEAIDCLERADNNNDEEGMAIVKLAELYTLIGDNEKAARCHERNIQRHHGMQDRMAKVGESILYLIDYFKASQQLERAQGFCLQVINMQVPPGQKERARAMLRDIQSSQQVLGLRE